jgi:hypothetical protein
MHTMSDHVRCYRRRVLGYREGRYLAQIILYCCYRVHKPSDRGYYDQGRVSLCPHVPGTLISIRPCMQENCPAFHARDLVGSLVHPSSSAHHIVVCARPHRCGLPRHHTWSLVSHVHPRMLPPCHSHVIHLLGDLAQTTFGHPVLP